MLYLDASAAIKLIYEEEQSKSLEAYINKTGLKCISSELIEVEIARTARRLSVLYPSTHAQFDKASQKLLQELELTELDRRVLNAAGKVPYPYLGTLDALHVASALMCGNEVDGFVTYDRRQLEAAKEVGLKAVSP